MFCFCFYLFPFCFLFLLAGVHFCVDCNGVLHLHLDEAVGANVCFYTGHSEINEENTGITKCLKNFWALSPSPTVALGPPSVKRVP